MTRFAVLPAFYGCCAISVALIFGLLAIGSHAAWFSWLKIGVGVVLGVEGFLLARDWRGARGLLLERLGRGRAARQGSLRRQLAGRAWDSGLQLLGTAWILAGLLAAALGVSGL
jgi:hypothetical protein